MRTLLAALGAAYLVGGFAYALYRDLVIDPKLRQEEEEERAYPKFHPTVSGCDISFEIEVGRVPLTIDYLEVSYGVFKYHMDFIRPHIENNERYTPVGDIEVLIDNTQVVLPPYSRRTFTCTLEPQDLPESWHDTGDGTTTGEHSGLRIFLSGSKTEAVLICPEGELRGMWGSALTPVRRG